MANARFQRASGLALALLVLVPGPGIALIQSLQQPALQPDEALPLDAFALADRAFIGSFDQLRDVEGAEELARLQPSLESLLRFYALEQGAILSPPLVPDAPSEDALAPALLALGAATGTAIPPGQLDAARALPAELQQALASLVLAYLQAAGDYARALRGVTFADLAAVQRGEAPGHEPDPGRVASAALLLDRAVREAAPALRKWGQLLELEHRTQHPRLQDLSLDGLLQAGAMAQSLRDTVQLASVMQGWMPVEARFEPTSSGPSEAFGRLYQALGVVVFPDDAVALMALDDQSQPTRELLVAVADGLREAVYALREAEGLVSQDEVDRALAELEALDLDALRGRDPRAYDTSELEPLLEVLQRADQSVQLRLRAAALLADALELAKQGALRGAFAQPAAGLGGPQTQAGPQTPLGPTPPLDLEIPIPAVGSCKVGETPGGAPYIDCPQVGNRTLSNLKCAPADCNPESDEQGRTLTLYLDEDDDGQPDEAEVILRTPATRDRSNDILFKDPYGLVLIGGQGRSVYDTRYGNVNISLRMENGTTALMRKVLNDPNAGGVFRSLIDENTNRTLFDPLDNGVVNITANPLNLSLLILDLGGDDLYTHLPGSGAQDLRLYNSSLNQEFQERGVPCFYADSAGVRLDPGSGNPFSGDGFRPPATEECDSERANQVVLFSEGLLGEEGGISDPTEPVEQNAPPQEFLVPTTYLNASNLSLPIRLGVAFDTSGSDTYTSQWNFTLGAADRGVGILWDAERCHPDAARVACDATNPGHDTYLGPFNSTGSAWNRGVGLLLDEQGNDQRSALNWSLGSGVKRGLGLLVDLAGDDRYFGTNYTMGFGGREVLRDPCTDPVHGPDGQVIRAHTCPPADKGVHDVAQRLGLGVLLDRRGADSYAQVNASSNQGKGWPALGLLLDLGGVDQGLQTNLTATGDFGTVTLGMQENTLFNYPSSGQLFLGFNAENNRALHNGRGGGLIVDAELTDTSTLAGRVGNAPTHGFGMQATELEGELNQVRCTGHGNFRTLFGQPPQPDGSGSFRCQGRGDSPVGNLESRDWRFIAGDKVLVRVPGLFGLGGIASNNDLEAPAALEEHLLHIDLRGHDIYRGPFGGAALPNLTSLDTEGSPARQDDPFTVEDESTPVQNPNMTPLLQAGLLAPVSLTIDAAGADLYDARQGTLGTDNATGAPKRRNLTTPSLGGAWSGLGLLYDLGEIATLPPSRPGGQPLACPAGTNDVYLAFNKTMGYGAVFGVGALVDQDGDDCYVALTGDTGMPNGTDAFSQGAAHLAGIGALVDLKGNDTYLAGNWSQGAAIVERPAKALPRRLGTGSGDPNSFQFHDQQPGANVGNLNVLRPLYTNTMQAFAALFDGRGRDAYTFGNFTQGHAERRNVITTPQETETGYLGERKALAALFVDDGFDLDTYRNHSRWAVNLSKLASHRDTAFWCSEENKGNLRDQAPANPSGGGAGTQSGLEPRAGVPDPADGLTRASAGVDKVVDAAQDTLAPVPLDDVRRAAQDQANRTIGSGGQEVNRALRTSEEGPNKKAQCLRVFVEQGPAGSTQAVRMVDTGTMGRGFDNLDFFANALLALGHFGQEYVRARSVLSAPSVVDVSCWNHNLTLLFPACGDLEGDVRVRARVLWGPSSFLYNANQLLRLVCAKVTGDDAACQQVIGSGNMGQTCQSVYGQTPGVDLDDPSGTFPNGIHYKDCRELLGAQLSDTAIGLNLTADTLKVIPQNAANMTGTSGNMLRNVSFFYRPRGTETDKFLGSFDRRAGLACDLDAQERFVEPCPGNVSAPERAENSDGGGGVGRFRLRWDTLALETSSDGLPDLRTPDGAHDLVVRAAWQPDQVGIAGAVLSPDDQRYMLNRLGDEYGFFPGLAVVPVVVDNPPVVYALRYTDVSGQPDRACSPLETAEECAAGQPHRELALNLTVSPRVNTSAPGYVVRADVIAPGQEGLGAGLAPATWACPDAPGTTPSPGPSFLPTACSRTALQAGKHGAREGIQAGWSEQGVGASLQDGSYVLRVNVTEPAHPSANGGLLPERGAVRCFVAHGDVLVPVQLPPDGDRPPCTGDLAMDSVVPDTRARFDPAHTGPDGSRYVNRSVAYPDPDRALRGMYNATVPLRFDTQNAHLKRSPVVNYTLRWVAEAGADARPVARLWFNQSQGSLPVTVCMDHEFVDNQSLAACLRRLTFPDFVDFQEQEDLNASTTLVRLRAQVQARDLAGNTEVIDLAGEVLAGEDLATLDVDPPQGAVCQAVPTNRPADALVPRARTRDRVIPMPWKESLVGCEGAILPRDNLGVDAMLIGFAVSTPDQTLGLENLTRAWRPPRAEQAERIARFDLDARGLGPEMVNNKTLTFAGRALDLAGNLQTQKVLLRRVTFDDQGPQLATLNLTWDHGKVTYRWNARDAEAGGKVARSYVAWGPPDPLTGTPNLSLEANATQIGAIATAEITGLVQHTAYDLQAVSIDDVGNVRRLPIARVVTDPIADVVIDQPRAGDILAGQVTLRLNVSDVRADPRLTYNISLVLESGNTTLELPVETLTRRECKPPEAECPTADSVIQFTRNLQTARFPDAKVAYVRVAVNSSLNPQHPYVVSVGPVTLDNSPPLTRLNITAQGGPVWWRSSALLVLEPLDNITGVTHTEWSFDNFTYEPYNASAPPIQEREGSFAFFFRSVDEAGNVEPLRQVSVNIDRQRPFGNLSINGGALGTADPNVTLTLYANDTLSGVANLTLDAGGPPLYLDHPERFARERTIPLTLPSGEGERRVRARLVDQAGNLQELRASILVDTSAPAVSDLRVERVAHTHAVLSWRTSEDSITRIEYGPLGAEVLANRFQSNLTTHSHLVTLQGLRPSTPYQFRVVAQDPLGNRAVQLGTFETLPDVSPPGAPSQLQALDLGNGAVQLTWEPAFDDVGVDHYIVFRGVAGQLDELARTTEALAIDDSPIPGVGYEYAVQAVDLAGQPGPMSLVALARATTRPVLLAGAVTPETGSTTQPFAYSVLVRDADGDAPSAVRVRITGQPHEMRAQFDGRADFAQGVLFTYETRLSSTTLSQGFPTYQFEAFDERGSVQFPQLPAAGPAVLGQGAIVPGLSAASNLLGLPGFELALAAAATGLALLVLHRRRRGKVQP